jgi:hypothetical protein
MILNDASADDILNDPDAGIVDSGTNQTILRHHSFFTYIIPSQSTITTISTLQSRLGDGYGEAKFTLPSGTLITIRDAMYALDKTNTRIHNTHKKEVEADLAKMIK